MTKKNNYILIAIITIIIIIIGLSIYFIIKNNDGYNKTNQESSYSNLSINNDSIYNLSSEVEMVKKRNETNSEIEKLSMKQVMLNSELQLKHIRHYREPVVFVPGLLSTKINIANTDWSKFKNCYYPEQQNGTLWSSINPVPSDWCQIELLTTGYNKYNEFGSNDNTTYSIEGDLGDINSCACLNYTADCLQGKGVIAKTFFDALIKVGYRNKVDLFAAGYDFRIVPYGNVFNYSSYSQRNNYIGQFFLQLKTIIERAYTQNSNSKVNLVGHSEGGKLIPLFVNVFRYFETTGDVEPGWVDTYISKLFLVGAAIEGSPRILQACLSGVNVFPMPPVVGITGLSDVVRTWASSSFLFPLFKESFIRDEGLFAIVGDRFLEVGTQNEVGNRDSTMVKFLTELASNNDKFKLLLDLYLNILDANLTAHYDPLLPVRLYLGTDDNTLKSLIYSDSDITKQPIQTIKTLDGDATVPTPKVLFNGTTYLYNGEQREIKKWQDVQAFNIKCPSQNDEDCHKALIANKEVIDMILDEVSIPEPDVPTCKIKFANSGTFEGQFNAKQDIVICNHGSCYNTTEEIYKSYMAIGYSSDWVTIDSYATIRVDYEDNLGYKADQLVIKDTQPGKEYIVYQSCSWFPPNPWGKPKPCLSVDSN